MASTQKYQATHSKDINGLSYKSSPYTYANELIVKTTDTVEETNEVKSGTQTVPNAGQIHNP
jgi:hypothetical protein